MKEEIIEQMADFVRGVAKQCSARPSQRSALCDQCWGTAAKRIAVELGPKSVVDLELVKVDILKHMEAGKWNSFAMLSKRTGHQQKLIMDAAHELQVAKLVAKRGLWIKGK